MRTFKYAVAVEAETQDQAEMVMGYRLGYEEEIAPEDGGPFDYTIDWQKADERVREALTRLTAPTPEGEESPDFDVDDVALLCEFAAQFA